MSKPFCSTGEPWDKESDLENHEEVWEVFKDNTNGDAILWVHGNDQHMELRMSRIGAIDLALILLKAAVHEFTYERILRLIKRSDLV